MIGGIIYNCNGRNNKNNHGPHTGCQRFLIVYCSQIKRIKYICKEQCKECYKVINHNYWLRGKDSNLRPLGYEPNSLAADVPRDICYISYT